MDARVKPAHDDVTRTRVLGAVAGLAIIIALIAAPFGLKPYGIYILTLWAVTTIAAIGLNLTLGYAGQVSLAQGAFVGIGAYVAALLTTPGWPLSSAYVIAAVSCFGIGWLLGYPALRVQHHYLAFVTLAFNTLVYLIFRNEEWLTNGIYGISNVPRPSVLGYSMKGPREFYYFCLAHLVVASAAAWWGIRSDLDEPHLRHQQRAAPIGARLLDEGAARVLLLLPRASRARVGGGVVGDSLRSGRTASTASAACRAHRCSATR